MSGRCPECACTTTEDLYDGKLYAYCDDSDCAYVFLADERDE